ncbi:glycosyl transferase [Candidatus Saccharibacteria bacterium CG10_big_fil_rev_8_21_14_0_10_47_8]|nr:MAG: glycosyl transferase [Candidatus Saccharibacteria bacterium CG10_big_fil_rev_8_21_14_0_10_47_8]
MQKVSIVIPNWNGADNLPSCLDSLQAQSLSAHIIVVDNGSQDSSVNLLNKKYPDVEIIRLPENRGFAGGVNAGIKQAIKLGSDYVALFNNDAVADKDWLKNLVQQMDKISRTGIVTSKIMSIDKKHLDSTGDQYTTWGLPYPRGRGEEVGDIYDQDINIFGASGGASLYRVKMLKEIGLFDEDFFAYNEDVDISFRAQLAGWKVAYEPRAKAYHKIGATSSRIKDFTVYHTMKNLPMLFWKNVPWQLMPRMLPRFNLAYWGIFFSAVKRGQGIAAMKGLGHFILLIPKKTMERHVIRNRRAVSVAYIASMLTYDLPPNASKLRALRSRWWKLKGKA